MKEQIILGGQALKGAFRRFYRGRATLGTAILVFATSVAATSAFMSLYRALYFDPIPGLENTGLLVRIYSVSRDDPSRLEYLTYDDYQDCCASPQLFERSAAFSIVDVSVRAANGTSQRKKASLVSGDYFATLQIEPLVGRFVASGDQAVAVLSYSLWQNVFGGADEVLGETLFVNGSPFTVIGIAPPGIELDLRRRLDVYLPLEAHALIARGIYEKYAGMKDRLNRWLEVLARIDTAEGALDTARQRLTTIADRISDLHPRTSARRTLVVEPLFETIFGRGDKSRVRGFVGLVGAAAGIVLILGSLTTTALLGVHTFGRLNELRLRRALGASRPALASQYLLDIAVVASVGSVAGAVVARVLIVLVQSLQLPERVDVAVQLDARILSLAIVLTALPVVVVSLPGLRNLIKRTSDAVLAQPGKGGSAARAPRVKLALVVVQCGLASASLLVFLLLLKTSESLLALEHGYDEQGAVIASLDPGASGYDPGESETFYENLQAAVARLPGVSAVGFVNGLPALDTPLAVFNLPFADADDREQDKGSNAYCVLVGGEYFRAAGQTLLAGRTFDTAQDTAFSRRVGIVNQTLASREAGHDLQVGDSLRLLNEAEEIEIIGIVADTAYMSVKEEKPLPVVYFWAPQAEKSPVLQTMLTSATMLARSDRDPRALTAEIVAAVASFDRELPVFSADTLKGRLGRASRAERQTAGILGGLAGATLLMAFVGIFGLLSFLIRAERKELGIRAALGASPKAAIWSYTRRGALVSASGVLLGLLGSLYAGRYLESLLFGLQWYDGKTYVGVAATMVLFVTLTSLVSARRAGTVDPATVLREL